MMLWRDRSLLFKTIFDSTFFSFVYLSSQFFSQAFFCFQCKLVQFSLFFFDTKFLLFPDWQEPREESVDTHKRNECLNEWMKKEKDVMKGKSCRHRCTFFAKKQESREKRLSVTACTQYRIPFDPLVCDVCLSIYFVVSDESRDEKKQTSSSSDKLTPNSRRDMRWPEEVTTRL